MAESRRAAKSAEVQAAVKAAMQRAEISEEAIRQATKDLLVEKTVIGACLLDPLSMEIAAEVIRPDDFTLRKHVEVWYAMQRLQNEGIGVDVLTVGSMLGESRTLADIGGTPALEEMTRGVTPIGFDIESYGKLLRRKTIARRMLEFSVQIGAMLNNGSSSNLIARAESMLMRISDTGVPEDDGEMSLEQTIDALSDGLREFLGASNAAMITTEWANVNTIVQGFLPGEFGILGGRPRSGKTAWASQFADYVAKRKPVLYCSLEMTRAAIYRRIMCSRLSILGRDVRRGEVPMQRFAEIDQWREEMNRSGLRVTTKARTVRAIRSICSKRISRGKEEPYRLIVADHLQLMRGREKRYGSKVQEMTEISGEIKELATDLNLTFLGLSQLSREGSKREDSRPKLEDLRESGALEQDCDTAMFVHRPELYDKDNPSLKGRAELHTLKQRDGAEGESKLTFEGIYYRFIDERTGPPQEKNVPPGD